MKNQNPFDSETPPKRYSPWVYFVLGFGTCIFVVVIITSIAAELDFSTNTQEDLAELECISMAQAVRAYLVRSDEMPSSLDDLIIRPAHMTNEQWRGPYLHHRSLQGGKTPIDPWANPFVLIIDKEQDTFVVLSAGVDGYVGTSDDIIIAGALPPSQNRA